jgi:hypothetical protein
VLRYIAMNLLRRESQHKRGIKARRKRDGWDRGYLQGNCIKFVPKFLIGSCGPSPYASV